MPKIAKELTNLEIKNLPLGTFAVGGVRGLCLRKKEEGGYFFLRYVSHTTGKKTG